MRARAQKDFRDLVIDGRLHPGLSAGSEYLVIEVSSIDLRIVDDWGEPILYPKEFFDITDTKIPRGWKYEEYPDGEFLLGPEYNAPGFYEQYFCSDGDLEKQVSAQRALRSSLEQARDCGDQADRDLVDRAMKRLAPIGCGVRPRPFPKP